MSTHRGFNHGASFDAKRIRAELNRSPWEPDDENPGTEIRSVWLGTIFGLTPSGKFYMPFACSNVAGDCPVCGGTGSIRPRTGRRVRARAKRRQSDFSRGTIARGTLGSPAGRAYADRVRAFRNAAFRISDTTCQACDGLGSISAARDERWNEAIEELAESISCYVDHRDESIFICESREAESDDSDSDDECDAESTVSP